MRIVSLRPGSEQCESVHRSSLVHRTPDGEDKDRKTENLLPPISYYSFIELGVNSWNFLLSPYFQILLRR